MAKTETKDAIISLRDIHKSYGKHAVLKGVNLDISKGNIFGLIGKNGSGKTTIFKVLLGLSAHQSGEVRIGGEPYEKGIQHTHIGFMVGSCFFPYMTAKQNMEYFCDMKGIKDKSEADRVLKIVGLEGVKTKFKGFSLGMKQRLGIANAILGNPEVVILDEPTNGLDPQGIADIRHLIQHLNREYKMTMIVSSHILSELQNTADTFGIVNNGVIAKVVTQEDLMVSDDIVSLKVSDGDKAREVLSAAGIEVLSTKQRTRNLEDIYFDLIGGDMDA
ncbi:MAG: ATP-binding cassette domain-containing protein [Eubacteriales bacterium]|nr:ATP-binding cassette domain-containing protein [Eubacteriales bacterium]